MGQISHGVEGHCLDRLYPQDMTRGQAQRLKTSQQNTCFDAITWCRWVRIVVGALLDSVAHSRLSRRILALQTKLQGVLASLSVSAVPAVQRPHKPVGRMLSAQTIRVSFCCINNYIADLSKYEGS